ncbi:DeoR/GlpR transcriptional regulator [Planosporangium flavigriseum]|uniref:Lactose phosphotransferase system repressor n=1 Tax=Planosporangium flavigriseum TaxID=373681 RepID=A0A8J3LZK3_9ACTN|nr:DeoR/GlpR family DNA-binding transcription regulator [Planosporangium flavigriseum]NJC68021.1 DeoR/GlpR transcriptional regulator [Planosporangium flavigriseum]GIG76644.1 DeoR family transcriptional regulator [Planosporangium flavigriseum]
MSESTASERTPYAAQRKQAIVTQLRANGRVDAADVADRLGVTKETVRKDLIALERQGLLRRVHGGAVPVEQLSFEPAVSTRTYYSEEKNRIATAALAHLPTSGSVLIDAGSTNARLAELFPADRELTVYTNSLSIALTLITRPRLTVVTLGGRVRPLTLAGVDDWAARALSEINVDVAFLGTNAVSAERGLTTPDHAEAAIKRLMLTSARQRILLADHSKVGAVSLCKHADLSDIDLFITDSGLPDADLKALRATGLEVELA